MTLRSILISLVAFFAAFQATAAEVPLLQAADYVQAKNEASTLTADEAKTIAERRLSKDTTGTYVVSMNRTALGSNAVTVVLPSGKVLRFVKTNGDKTSWAGEAEGGAIMGLGFDGGISGRIFDGRTVYVIRHVNARLQTITVAQPPPDVDDDVVIPKKIGVPK